MQYKETILWKKSFVNIQPQHKDWSIYLEKEYEKARENISGILKKIRDDFPQLTIHDITHTDALWQTGSVIAGDSIDMNPLEGFVLGCAFLMHDAMLSFAAIGGEDTLRNTVQWKDIYADYRNKDSMLEEEKIKETDFRTIRALHAIYAEKMYQMLFHRDDGSNYYIIDDETLRNHLGEKIGEIAASHHWDIEKVDNMDVQCPPIAGYPSDWNINPLKLACILRCADAAHIDSGRAPDYLYKLLTINGVSRYHWSAQNKLSQIAVDRADRDKAIICSEISFPIEEFAAWNVAFDAVKVLDCEIKASNECLKKHNQQVFAVKGISGAESEEALAKYIKTNGWMPCSAKIHISDIESLVKNLGGEKLYGKENHLEIAIRELVQNSRDAIIARKVFEENLEGKIDISIKQDNEITTVTVVDNGLGMSMHTIKNCFLNFGNSYWYSDLSKEERSGLHASGFKSIGQFGIGFYAVFMVASKVVVETRQYDKGLDENITITFPNGLCLRPIISRKRGDSTAISTKIELTIDNKMCKWENMVQLKAAITNAIPFNVPYSAVLSNLVAGLDVDVYYSENNEPSKIIHKNINQLELGTPSIAEWLKDITYARFQNNSSKICHYIDKNYKRIKKIYSNGSFYGIALLNTYWDEYVTCFDITTIGGLSNCSHGSTNPQYIGCLIASPDTASRNNIYEKVDMTEWARDQYNMLCKQGLTVNDRIMLPYTLGEYGVDMTDNMLVRVMTKGNPSIVILSIQNLLNDMKNGGFKLVLPITKIGEHLRLEYYLDHQRTMQCLEPNEVLYIVEKNSGFLDVDEETEYPYNALKCIKMVADKGNIVLDQQKAKNKACSRLGGMCDAYIVSVKNSKN